MEYQHCATLSSCYSNTFCGSLDRFDYCIEFIDGAWHRASAVKIRPFLVDNNIQEITAENPAKTNVTYPTDDKSIQ